MSSNQRYGEEFQQLSYQDLRSECRKRNLCAIGTSDAMRRRLTEFVAQQKRIRQWSTTISIQDESNENENVIVLRDDDDDGGGGGGNENKKQLGGEEEEDMDDEPPRKRPKKSPADDLLCPITLGLPFEPVIAEDGRVYEQDAIEMHCKVARESHGVVKSPITNQVIGSRLLPAPQIKNLIETLIENEMIQGELVAEWKKRAQLEKEKQGLLLEAQTDSEAMYKIGCLYARGENGFKKDAKEAHTWFQKGHAAGNVKATASLGENLLSGNGAPRHTAQGMIYISLAACRGSDLAAYHLGMALAHGLHGLSMDEGEGVRWLRKCLLVCSHSHLDQGLRDFAEAVLEELKDDDDDGSDDDEDDEEE
ncbi:Sel1 domain protein repeat-containing protein [Seminavis robusta]|uniref:Sel1 domain protein repeat-containing protein n=1 Tax=Seminavis robusta TaxID=568900 RepID=A0A9N8DKW6_9STRA|nr:Sel1 domain protein repeat-containing protein [Seminavis robusta]|eukprot:Sro214_g088890.1 Sel1 domain protein repeat-containing protein (364) ;mRNA; r:88223-89396